MSNVIDFQKYKKAKQAKKVDTYLFDVSPDLEYKISWLTDTLVVDVHQFDLPTKYDDSDIIHFSIWNNK